jgi:hypothetical protein
MDGEQFDAFVERGTPRFTHRIAVSGIAASVDGVPAQSFGDALEIANRPRQDATADLQTERSAMTAQPVAIGDTVRVLPNPVKAPVGSIGTVVGFTEMGGHPLVAFAANGRSLIPARCLEQVAGPAPQRPADPARVPLGDAVRIRAVDPVSAAPMVDWAEAPDPKFRDLVDPRRGR